MSQLATSPSTPMHTGGCFCSHPQIRIRAHYCVLPPQNNWQRCNRDTINKVDIGLSKRGIADLVSSGFVLCFPIRTTARGRIGEIFTRLMRMYACKTTLSWILISLLLAHATTQVILHCIAHRLESVPDYVLWLAGVFCRVKKVAFRVSIFCEGHEAESWYTSVSLAWLLMCCCRSSARPAGVSGLHHRQGR